MRVALWLWWTKCRRALRQWTLLRRDSRQLALVLHASNAWHCGCGPCTSKRGDSRRVLGVLVQTVVLTDAQRGALEHPEHVRLQQAKKSHNA